MKKIIFILFLFFPATLWAGQAHIGLCDKQDNCEVTVHFDMPSGDNTAGFSWQTVFTDTGVVTATRLSDTLINSNTEKTNIANGSLLEINLGKISLIGVKNAGTLADQKAALDLLTDPSAKLVTDEVGIIQDTHRWYGYQQPPQ
jgi:hypothetical protein